MIVYIRFDIGEHSYHDILDIKTLCYFYRLKNTLVYCFRAKFVFEFLSVFKQILSLIFYIYIYIFI